MLKLIDLLLNILNMRYLPINIEDNKNIDTEINMLIEEVNRLSLLAHIKNKTIETKMIKNYEYETESSCQ